MAGEAEPHEYTASLRVWSATLTRDELIGALGEPTSSYNAGDPVSSRNPHGPKREHSLWSLEKEHDRQSMIGQLTALVAFVEHRRVAFERLRRDCVMDIFCGIFSGVDAQGGFTMEVDLLRRLADLELAVTFDLY